jgi:transcriptional repressor NrdR
MVLKKSGRKVPFEREKLMKSFDIALRKRHVDRDRVERAVSGIIRRLESSGETEISSEDIGLQVLEALKGLDDVAFVRYASVYRDFTHIEDFSEAITQISAKIAREPGEER